MKPKDYAMRNELLIVLCFVSLATLQSARADDIYVRPKLHDGALIISRTDHLSVRQQLLLKAEFERRAVTLITLGKEPAESIDAKQAADVDTRKLDALACLRSIDWQKSLAWDARADQSTASVRETWLNELGNLSSGSCVWIDADHLPKADDWFQTELRKALDRGAVVCIESSAPSIKTRGPFPLDITLLPFVHWMRAADSDETDQSVLPSNDDLKLANQLIADRLFIDVPAGAWLRVGERELINLSEPDVRPCRLIWPATPSYDQPVIETLPSRRVSDLVAARRALMERAQPHFPAAGPIDSKLSAGSLVIVGGGGASTEIWKRFIELAGGTSKASIVVLPTAQPDPTDDGVEVQILKRLGVEHLHVLTQTSREEVSGDEFLATLRSATGVWFGGGRQWRFVDAYWGTPAWEALRQVVERGGVIGGSSAGATIQGDLLVRGSPLGNQIMICDGYRHGLALLPGVAIDQHFRQRNRFDDLKSVLKRFPAVTGIGIDEGTALVVEAPSRCEVLGAGSVWLSYAGQHASDSTNSNGYIERPSGSKFEFGK